MALKKILESIFEQDFIDTSYGFRPHRSCHDALKKLDKIIMNGLVNFVVDMDISKFFDTVDHKILMECLEKRIADPSLLQLIGRFLKSGIMEDGIYFDTEMGTPQGGILSPVLANVYLHYALDKWFVDVVMHNLSAMQMILSFVLRKNPKPWHLETI
jgi:retron-type reverse transcriptase